MPAAKKKDDEKAGTASRRTRWGRCTCRRTGSGARRRSARSRTSASRAAGCRREFLRALAAIKWAAAKANEELGLLDAEGRDGDPRGGRRGDRGEARRRVPARRVPDRLGHLDEHEHERGAREPRERARSAASPGRRSPVHPNDHVNLGQSSNDAIPTALHLSVARAREGAPDPRARARWPPRCSTKAKALDDVVKVGRTHLQDATPITLGQVFRGYAAQVGALAASASRSATTGSSRSRSAGRPSARASAATPSSTRVALAAPRGEHRARAAGGAQLLRAAGRPRGVRVLRGRDGRGRAAR